MINHPNRSQTYTVLNRHGAMQDDGLSLADAAQIMMGYDGHEYEIKDSDGIGFDLWTSNFSRNSGAFKGLTKSVIYSVNEDRALAEAEIYRKVIKNAEWFCGCTVMTDAEHAEMTARTASEAE
jgi:hypothetical protein